MTIEEFDKETINEREKTGTQNTIKVQIAYTDTVENRLTVDKQVDENDTFKIAAGDLIVTVS